MGCAASSEVAGPLEQRLVASVVAAKRRAGSAPKVATPHLHPSMNGLLMSFHSTIRPGVERLKALHHELQTQGKVPFEKLERMGDSPEFKSLLQAARQECGRDGVDFDQFVVICTVLQLTDAKCELHQPEIEKALNVVEEAFLYFDSSANGTLERGELVLALASGTKRFDTKQRREKDAKKQHGACRGPGELLFDVLDLDKSGTITLREFLLGIVKIVQSSELAEEEEELEELRAASPQPT